MLDKLIENLSFAWSKDTSSDPENWSLDNPALGQCAVTACVVQDETGGDIVWANAVLPNGGSVSHYFNRLSDGSIIDLTRRQFPDGTQMKPEGGMDKKKEFDTTRDYVLSFKTTQERYARLKTAMQGVVK